MSTARRMVAVVACTAAAAAVLPAHAGAFGSWTILPGQNGEHERITREAVGCASTSGTGCFQPASLRELAGEKFYLGAVGNPDLWEVFGHPEAHCDDADHLDTPRYPQSRAAARAALDACVAHLRKRFEEGQRFAAQTVSPKGVIDPDESKMRGGCRLDGTSGEDARTAKCAALLAFGRALHGVQDFYAHSNWTDQAAAPYGVENPPGLGLAAPSPLLDLRSLARPTPPEGFTTGCFSGWPIVGCRRRITHATLNKDKPSAPRSAGGNFARAWAGAVAETRRQWADFRAALVSRYGGRRGALIACTLTHDQPVTECPRFVVRYRATIGSHSVSDDPPITPKETAGRIEQTTSASLLAQPVKLTGKGTDTDPFRGMGGLQALRPVYDMSDDKAVALHPLCDGEYASFHQTSHLLGVGPGHLTVSGMTAVLNSDGDVVDYHGDVSLDGLPAHVATNSISGPPCAGNIDTVGDEDPILGTEAEAHEGNNRFVLDHWDLKPADPEGDGIVARKTLDYHTSGASQTTVHEVFELALDPDSVTASATGAHTGSPRIAPVGQPSAAAPHAQAASRVGARQRLAAVALRRWHRAVAAGTFHVACGLMTRAAQAELATLVQLHGCHRALAAARRVMTRRDRRGFAHVRVRPRAISVHRGHRTAAAPVRAFRYRPRPAADIRFETTVPLVRRAGQWRLASVVQVRRRD